MRYLHSRQFRSEAGELRLPIMNVPSELLRLCQELLQRHLVDAVAMTTQPDQCNAAAAAAAPFR